MSKIIGDTKDAAEFLGVDESTVTREAKKGKIPGARKIGYRWKFHLPSLENYFIAPPVTEKTQ
jgi:excisionase family DNA binding protein